MADYFADSSALVKHYFRDMSATCVCPPGLPVCICGAQPRVRLVIRHGIKPTTMEIARNPRSRSATLRAVERLADPILAGSRAR